jgi:hypothetical protein
VERHQRLAAAPLHRGSAGVAIARAAGGLYTSCHTHTPRTEW